MLQALAEPRREGRSFYGPFMDNASNDAAIDICLFYARNSHIVLEINPCRIEGQD
jgi:hypothetical protein